LIVAMTDFDGTGRGIGKALALSAARPRPPIKSGVNSSGDPVVSTGFPLARE
jgi:hypothetical protein